MEITGKILQKNETRKISETFSVQEFIADCGTTNQMQEWRENILKFQVANAKIEELAKISVGSVVKISFFPNGRWYDKRDGSGRDAAFNLDAFKFEVLKPAETDANTHATAEDKKEHY